MRLLAVMIIGLSAWHSLVLASICTDKLTYKIIADQKVDKGILQIGAKVRIQSKDSTIRQAFFLGTTEGKAYFAPLEAAGLKRPLFFLPLEDVQFSDEYEFASGSAAVQPLQPMPLLTFDASKDGEDCGPQTVMACLTHLDRMGLLNEAAHNVLTSDRELLLQNLIHSFSRNSIANDEEGSLLVARLNSATDRKTRKELTEQMRSYAFDRVLSWLKTLGVKNELTTSYSKLIRHLKAGKPAYISTAATTVGIAAPHLEQWDETLPFHHPDIHTGSLPMPKWAPAFSGYHAVYALGVLPRTSGIGGFLRGYRVVILDPEGGRLNIWNTFNLRFSGTAKFILIGE